MVSWLDGGITAVSNLALLCKRDHRDLHSGHWRIRILDGVVEVTRPTWADPTPIPPTKYKPPTADIVHQPITPPLNPRGGDERPPDANAGALGSAPAARAAPPTPAGSARPGLSHPWNDENTPDAATSPPDTATVTGVFGRASFDPWGEGATGVG